MVNGLHIYSAFIRSTFQYCLTFTQITKYEMGEGSRWLVVCLQQGFVIGPRDCGGVNQPAGVESEQKLRESSSVCLFQPPHKAEAAKACGGAG